MCVPGRLGAGNLPARVSHAAMAWSYFFSMAKLCPTSKRSCGTRPSSGFCAAKARDAARASAYLLAAQEVLGDLHLRVEDGPLGVGRLRPVGIFREVALVGGDRLVELALTLEDLADQELGGHQQLGLLAARLVVAGRARPA